MATEKTTVALTKEQTLRLQLLQLAYRHDKDAPTIVDKADQLAQYVLTGKKVKPG